MTQSRFDLAAWDARFAKLLENAGPLVTWEEVQSMLSLCRELRAALDEHYLSKADAPVGVLMAEGEDVLAVQQGPAKNLVIGERFNWPQGPGAQVFKRALKMRPRKWIEVSLAQGALHGNKRLIDLGVPVPKSGDDNSPETETMNLLPPAYKEEEWNAGRARMIAEVILEETRAERLYLIGRRVATAFGARRWPMCHSGFLGEPNHSPLGIVIPHPSGLNHWWNDDIEVSVGRELVQEFNKL